MGVYYEDVIFGEHLELVAYQGKGQKTEMDIIESSWRIHVQELEETSSGKWGLIEFIPFYLDVVSVQEERLVRGCVPLIFARHLSYSA